MITIALLGARCEGRCPVHAPSLQSSKPPVPTCDWEGQSWASDPLVHHQSPWPCNHEKAST